MKVYIKFMTLALCASLVLGCGAAKNANNKQKGAVIGAAGGAVIGGVIGNNVGKGGNTVLGAIIGGVVGGVAGGYIGDRMDRQAERIEEEVPGAVVNRVGEGINVTFTEDAGVYFETNKSAVKGTSVATLDKLAGIFKEYPNSVILIEGHTDSAGPEDYNMDLSKRRAESVTNYLISQGISPGRFTTKWYGENQPKADNATAEGKAQNRRVELGIIASEALKEEAKEKTGG
ncbi:MAG: OmpA family protein [Flavobacteriaceae bacterium]|nr:OmpA family protein [Flavobacteriaceae bacterium]MDH3796234.1 OmpA family protein [Flavobacteriaceae bacterium]